MVETRGDRSKLSHKLDRKMSKKIDNKEMIQFKSVAFVSYLVSKKEK